MGRILWGKYEFLRTEYPVWFTKDTEEGIQVEYANKIPVSGWRKDELWIARLILSTRTWQVIKRGSQTSCAERTEQFRTEIKVIGFRKNRSKRILKHFMWIWGMSFYIGKILVRNLRFPWFVYLRLL